MTNAPDPQKKVAWITFENDAAKLKRVIAPHNVKGLILRTADTEEGREIRKRALEHGFTELKTSGVLRMLFPDGKITQTARMLHEGIGGQFTVLTVEELASPEWTLNLSERSPVATKAPSNKKEPNASEMETIGLNMHGQEVVRDGQGRFLRRIDAATGKSEFIHESEEASPLSFLRAHKMEDLIAIAGALMVSAERGTLHKESFERVIDAALETLEAPDRDLCIARVREQMMRQIASVAVENSGNREAFQRALRLSSNSSFLLSRPSDDGQLSPAPALVSFLRRQFIGVTEVDFQGHDDMKPALPRLVRETAAHQFHDLGAVDDDDLGAYTMNILSRRAPEGRTIFRLATENEETIEKLRHAIGTIYALETVAEVSPVASDGIRQGAGSTLFFIGELRPQPLEALPQAALRTFKVVVGEDFMNLEREILRSRAKIREFHKGEAAEVEAAEDGREENQRQKPYQPLSSLREPFTMIPMALEGATAKALTRVQAFMNERGGADAAVAAALGESLDTLPEILSAEQIDAVAMQLTAQERGRGFLLSDQTGVGKGRSLAAMAKAWLRADPRNKVLYYTESGEINVPDVCRDFKAVGAWNKDESLFLTSGSVLEKPVLDAALGEPVIDPETGDVMKEIEMTNLNLQDRLAILSSGEWPRDKRVIITTYTQFRGKEEDVSTQWIETALDEHTLVVMDEAHNGLNPASRQGQNLRRVLNAVPDENTLFGTATPFREPKGMDLYKSLLPGNGTEEIKALTDGVAIGGEVAQEVFASMLAEDGVFLRRDHDLSSIEFQVALPDDATIRRYQAQMNTISPVVELMIEASGIISERLGRRAAREYAQARARGLSHPAARAASNELNQYSIALGSPLSQLSRIAMNALKIDQVVDEALAEIAEGRKPLITFHSTNEALLKELSRGVHWVNLQKSISAHLRAQARALVPAAPVAEEPAEGQEPADPPAPVEPDAQTQARIVAIHAANRQIERIFNQRQEAQEELERDVLVDRLRDIDLEEPIFNEIVDMIDAAYEKPRGPTLDERMAGANNLSLRDQIARIHEGIYKIRLEGARVDARDEYPDVAEIAEMIEGRIDEISRDLPVSPVDALIARLEENGVAVGEISGRTLCYRNNRIERRSKEDRNKRKVIDAFNSGGFDVLIYNGAGATGGSFHASADFRDQRPRTMLELEAPTDIIKYVQAQGRGNRYGQVHNPRVKSVMTGLTPEMRILQQRNRKLRMLGASVDGNRSHPLLLDDVPDLLNKVGDEATRNVLLASPALARRLGFAEIVEEEERRQARGNTENDDGTGALQNEIDSLANKVLTRSIMLSGADQDDLVARIRLEFDALIEELDSRNENPLRPKELAGQIDVVSTSLFSGIETDRDDLNVSAFQAPLYIKTGVHHFTDNAWSGEDLVERVERSKRVFGTEGFRPAAERIKQNLPTLLRPYLLEGMTIERALDDPEAAGLRFSRAHQKLTDLAWLLENLVPGVAMRYEDPIFDPMAQLRRTVVELIPPSDPSHLDLPSAYKIRTIAPGMGRPETVSLSRIMRLTSMDRIFFRPGISEEYSETYLEEFNRDALFEQRMPVQVLSGNILRAITEASQNNLGSVSLWRDREDHIHRGIVVQKNKIDLEALPVRLPGGAHAAEMGHRFLNDPQYREIARSLRFYGDDGENTPPPKEIAFAELYLSLTTKMLTVQLPPLRKKTEEFYRSRPGLYEAVYGEALPEPDKVPKNAVRRKATKAGRSRYDVQIDVTDEAGRQRAMSVLARLNGMSLYIDGAFRDLFNDVSQDVDRMQGHLAPVVIEADAAEAEAPEAEEAEQEGPVIFTPPGENDDYDNVEWNA